MECMILTLPWWKTILQDAELSCLSELTNEAAIMSLHHHRCVIEFYGVSSDKVLVQSLECKKNYVIIIRKVHCVVKKNVSVRQERTGR